MSQPDRAVPRPQGSAVQRVLVTLCSDEAKPQWAEQLRWANLVLRGAEATS